MDDRNAGRRGAVRRGSDHSRGCGGTRQKPGYIDTAFVTRSNVRLFAVAQPVSRTRRIPNSPRNHVRRAGSPRGPRNETHLSAIQGSPRANARVSRPDENGRRSQGTFGAPRQGPRAPHRLTIVRCPIPRRRAACYRLRGAGVFEALFKTGARHDAHFLQLIAAPAANPPGRIGYVIGRKVMRRSVDRNRLRRRLRESARMARPAIEAFDIIVRVKRPVRVADIGAANAESRRLLARIVS